MTKTEALLVGPGNPAFWILGVCFLYFGFRVLRRVGSGMQPPLFISLVLFAVLFLWGQDFRHLNPWIAAGVLVLLVVVDRLSPSALFPGEVLNQDQPYPWLPVSEGSEPQGDLKKNIIENYDVHFDTPGNWKRKESEPEYGEGTFVIQFQGSEPRQFISLRINEIDSVQALPEQVRTHVRAEVIKQHGSLRALGKMSLSNDTNAIWAEYTLMGIKRERRICFILDSREYVIAFSSGMERFTNDLLVFNDVLRSFRVNGAKFLIEIPSMPENQLAWEATPFEQPSAPIDLFISYKSENVSIARRVAEQLLASGIKVWFAEYYILLEDRKKFQVQINEGIHRSAYGLILTNKLWANSRYTRLEIKKMQKAYGEMASKRIIEVKIPEEPWEPPYTRNEYPRFCVLQECDSVGIQPGTHAQNINEILKFLENHLGFKILKLPPAEESGSHQEFRGTHMGHQYRLDISGWNLISSGGGQDSDGDTRGPVLGRQAGKRKIGATLILGIDPPGERLPIQGGEKSSNDRELYDSLIDKLAGPYMKGLKSKPRAIHLFFHGGFSQLAITYWLDSLKAWVRMYSIILPCPDENDNRVGEFVFTCFFHGPFREYCQYTPVMDRLVTSLKWGSGVEEKKIVEAVKARNLEEVQAMLKKNKSLMNASGAQGGTLLHDAAFDNWTPAVELLVSLGADVNARTQQGNLTPLHCLSRGTAETAKVLLDHFAEVDARNDDSWTPLHTASFEDNIGLAEALLDSKANIDARQKDEWTPLHIAAMYGKDKVAGLLIARGCKINARSRSGATPLHMAAGNGKKSLAELLLSAGAKINERTRAGETPLTVAIKQGNSVMADWLRSSGGEK